MMGLGPCGHKQAKCVVANYWQCPICDAPTSDEASTIPSVNYVGSIAQSIGRALRSTVTPGTITFYRGAAATADIVTSEKILWSTTKQLSGWEQWSAPLSAIAEDLGSHVKLKVGTKMTKVLIAAASTRLSVYRPPGLTDAVITNAMTLLAKKRSPNYEEWTVPANAVTTDTGTHVRLKLGTIMVKVTSGVTAPGPSTGASGAIVTVWRQLGNPAWTVISELSRWPKNEPTGKIQHEAWTAPADAVVEDMGAQLRFKVGTKLTRVGVTTPSMGMMVKCNVVTVVLTFFASL